MYKDNNTELQLHTEITNKKKNVAVKVYKAINAFARLCFVVVFFYNVFLLRDKEQNTQKYPNAAELFSDGGPK